MPRTITTKRFLIRSFGGSGVFNGSDNYVSAGTYGSLGSSMANGFSASFWLLSQSKVAGTILGTRVSSTNNYLVVKTNTQSGSNAAGWIQVQFTDHNNPTTNGYAKIAQVNNGNWHHIVVTLLPSTNTITVYIDNVAQTVSYTTQSTPSSFIDFSRPIYFGALNNNNVAAAPFYKGLLGEITLWNKILSPTDVENLYYTGTTTTAPLSYHRFSEGSGTSVADSVGSNTGTWNGTLGSQWSTDTFMKLRPASSARTASSTRKSLYGYAGFDRMRCWEYSSNYLNGASTNDWYVQDSQIPFDAADIAAAGMNVVKIYADENNASSHIAALDKIAAAGLKAIVLRFITYNTDYSESSGQTNRTAAIAKFTGMINNLKEHSAVIGWGFGNENNFNLGTTSKHDWYTLLEEAIQAGKAIDSTRFYWTSNGEIADIAFANDLVPSIDMWGANIYRGTTFTDIVADIQAATDKPFFLSEFGQARTTNDQADQDTQAAQDLALIQEAESYFPTIRAWSHFKFTDTVAPGTVYGVTAPLDQGTYQSRTKYSGYTTIKNYLTTTIYGG